MVYPRTPDFTTAPTDASTEYFLPAWWTYTRDNGAINVCSTTGAYVVRRARASLGLSDSSTWDSDLQSALIAHAQQLNAAQGGWDAMMSELQAGLDRRQVTNNALKLAIWFAFYQPNGLRLDAIDSPDAMAPGFDVALPDGYGNSTLMACFDPNADPSTQNLSATDFAAAQQASASGIRIHAGESLPSPTAPVPPGPAGLSTTAIAVIGISLAAVAGVVVLSNTAYVTKTRSGRR